MKGGYTRVDVEAKMYGALELWRRKGVEV